MPRLVADDRLARVLAGKDGRRLGDCQPACRIGRFMCRGMADRERQAADSRRRLGCEDEIVLGRREQALGDDMRVVRIDALEDEGEGICLDPRDDVLFLDRLAKDAGEPLDQFADGFVAILMLQAGKIDDLDEHKRARFGRGRCRMHLLQRLEQADAVGEARQMVPLHRRLRCADGTIGTLQAFKSLQDLG